MNKVIISGPIPHCVLLCTDNRRQHSKDTDIRKTFDMYRPVHVKNQTGDDYDRVQNDDWLNTGGFK